MNLSRIYAIVFGVVYTLVGLLGLAVSTSLGWPGRRPSVPPPSRTG
jgi:hypothetical protein